MAVIDRYADSIDGNDATGDGSISSPYQTLAKVLTGADWRHRLNLKAGSHWRETLELQPGAIARAYGSGEKPIIDASDVAANASFSATADRTAVYEISWAHTIAGAEIARFSLWEDGVRLRRASDVADCESTAGSFYAPAVSTSPQTIYLHASDSSDVMANGKLYEISARDYAIRGKVAAKVSGLHGKRSAHNNGVGAFGRFALIRDCLFEDGTKHNLFVSARAVVEDVECWKMDPSWAGAPASGVSTHFVCFDLAGIGADATFRRCIARLGYAFPEYNGNPSVGFLGHTESGDLDVMRYYDCQAIDVGTAAAGGISRIVQGCTSQNVLVDWPSST